MKSTRLTPTLPVVDLERAKRFYVDKLGFKVVMEDPSPGALLQTEGTCGNLYIYQRAPTKADHTVAGFTVEDVEATVKELREKGIVFEEYDLPNLKTTNGIFSMNGYKAAWFKDTEGNILAVSNM